MSSPFWAPFEATAQQPKAIDEVFECLARPIADNTGFVACLMPLDLEVFDEAVQNDVESLKSLTTETNVHTRELLHRVGGALSTSDAAGMTARLNRDGFEFFSSCLEYELAVEGVPEDLALARCNMNAEFFILHFLFDNYAAYWVVPAQ